MREGDCQSCGEEMTLRSQDYEHTEYCDRCAQLLGPILLEALQGLVEEVYVPDGNCSCHISPPCSDCVENSCLRERLENAKDAIAKTKAGMT